MKRIYTLFTIFLLYFVAKSTTDTLYNEGCGCGDSSMGNNNNNDQIEPFHYNSKPTATINDHHSNNPYAKPSSLMMKQETKRETGIVYGNGGPIGILQPYKRSYKFMPVKEDYNGAAAAANSLYKIDQITGVYKRENVDKRRAAGNDEYPSILANFNIHTKLDRSIDDRKRNDDSSKTNNINNDDDRTATNTDAKGGGGIALRRMRSPDDSILDQQLVDGQLDSIINDMGLDKRDVAASSEQPSNGGGDDDDVITPQAVAASATSISVEEDLISRGKRQLSSADDYQTRITQQIQNKITALKEQVKREVDNLKNQVNERKKRQSNDDVAVMNTLLDEEHDNINPAIVDNDLTELIRKKRLINKNEEKMQMAKEQRKRREVMVDQEDLIDDEDDELRQRRDYEWSDDNVDYGDDADDDVDDRSKREENNDADDDIKVKSMTVQQPRQRRDLIDETLMVDHPQQLADMSELDLFGALPPGYDGELSRFKRIKRFKKQ